MADEKSWHQVLFQSYRKMYRDAPFFILFKLHIFLMRLPNVLVRTIGYLVLHCHLNQSIIIIVTVYLVIN